MDICMLVEDYPPRLGGGGFFVKQLSENLSGTNRITIVTPAYGLGDSQKDENSIKVIRKGGSRITYFPKTFFSLISSPGFDVYHAHGTPAAFLAKLISLFKKSKIILHIHGYRTKKTSGFFKYYIQNFIIKLGYDKIISVDKESTKKIIELGVPAEKIVTIPVGVDTKKFSPSGKEKSGNVFLFVGRLEKVKGIDIMLETSKLLSEINSKAEFWIAGSGSLEEKIKSIPNVKPLGIIPHDELNEVYNAADFFLLPSLSEGNPLVLMEALSCGLPVVVSDIPSLSEIAEQSGAGLTFPPGDSKRLAEVAEFLLNSKNLDDFRKNARNFAEKNYSWDKVSSEIRKVYGEFQ